ncbi:MAG: hypothetical protein ACI3XQ_11490 [Eubacteriales bacterium]
MARGYTGNTSFGGYDARRAAGDGACADMQNMSARFLPAMAARGKRRYYGYGYDNLQGIYFGDRIYHIADNIFYDDYTEVCRVDDGEKNMCVLGDILYIYPDKIIYDTKKKTLRDLDDATIDFTDSSSTRTFRFEYSEEDPTTGVSGYYNCIHQNYVEPLFKKGDIVEVKAGATKVTASILNIVRLDNANYPGYNDGWYIFFSDYALKDIYGNYSTSYIDIYASIRYPVPDMDFVFASDNRLWGAKGREIYASALGQGDVWMDYDVLSTSSWAATTGSGDSITACVDFNGMPVFFTENAIYKIYGDTPSDFAYVRSSALGVRSGEHKSLCAAGAYLFYLSKAGICAYTGGVPEIISRPLGERMIKNGVSGSDGVYYYISCTDGERTSLFCFDIARSVWIREDDTRAQYIGMDGISLVCIDDEGNLFEIGDVPEYETGETEKTVNWYLETNDINDGTVERKHANRLMMRYESEEGTSGSVLVSFDGGAFTEVGRIIDTDGRVITGIYPLPSVRYDNMRIRAEGCGNIIIYALIRDARTAGEKPEGDRNVYV